MTPEQDKELIDLVKEHLRVQKRMLVALAAPGLVITILGGLVLWSYLQHMMKYGGFGL